MKKNKYDKIFINLLLIFFLINVLSLNKAYTIVPGSTPSRGSSASASSAIVANLPGAITVDTSLKAFIKYVKNGLSQIFYTSYLPPIGTYNDNANFEHILPACDVIAGDALKVIGNDCMIKIPFECSNASKPSLILDPKNPGVNCLNYSSLFTLNSDKKYSPNSSLNINKPYCHGQTWCDT